jgi:drug/metabolite transporter (DMT)-like permease
MARQGVWWVIGAAACFGALDTTVKSISLLVPLAMALWVRFLFQAVVTAAALWPQRGPAMLRTRLPGLQLLRGALLASASAMAFLSLQHMPVGEFTAIIMLAPLVITVVAALRYGERVTPGQWALLMGGFIGALVVIRPGGASFTWALLLPLAAMTCAALFQLLTSRMAQVEDAGTMHLYTGVVGTALTSAALPWMWQALPAGTLWLALAAIGIFSSTGHILLIQGYRRSAASVLTPYLYFQVAFATLGGAIAFGHWPDAWGLAGIALIVACGVAGTWLAAHASRAAQTLQFDE